MKALLLTSVVVLAIFLVDLIRNDKHKYYYYILMFVLMFFANYIFSSTVEASENMNMSLMQMMPIMHQKFSAFLILKLR
ncbi:unknown protein [Parachlamydia acanthamoebae UV-7]|jgi:hypothetical protein|uniref:Uncharacterized protein n=2 Tax=Parachlamydia acanthamoebae TaxID=83552 RepID=F8KVR8_PARAV|nr:hypothetical protein DB43_AL00040 [Parachlamydia acanthamoebae]CCB85204.1 unknown protein [Parachlamydia acanthamoebae UV-7]